jgi:hypothetical protein
LRPAAIPPLPTIDQPAPLDLAGLEPVETLKRRWPTILATLLTLATLVALARELFGSGLVGLERAVPVSPLFYLCFALLYLCTPVGDLLIYRYLWRIPWGGGFVALNKKRVANDVVLGYSGDVFFYAWARARARLVTAPFGAVKDVTLLSGVAGNAATVVLCALALPLGYQLIPPHYLRAALASVAVVLAFSLAILAWSKRIFSLPRRELTVVFALHCGRLALSSVLVALCWHFAMPGVSVGMWLFLSAARLLVSRLPFMPNKDLLFATIAILLIGQDQALSEMIAFTAALTLLAHGGVIGAASLGGVATKAREWVKR